MAISASEVANGIIVTNMLYRLLAVILLGAFFFIPLSVIAEGMPMPTLLPTRDERLDQAIKNQQLVLDDATRAAVVQKCQNTQSILANLQEKSDKVVRLRLETYALIQQELQAIKLRMARQGVDASELDLLVGKLQQGMDAFTLASDAHGVALDDVIVVDCMQRPEQFRAGIVMMRAKRATLFDAATNLRWIMLTAENTTFNQLKDRLRV